MAKRRHVHVVIPDSDLESDSPSSESIASSGLSMKGGLNFRPLPSSDAPALPPAADVTTTTPKCIPSPSSSSSIPRTTPSGLTLSIHPRIQVSVSEQGHRSTRNQEVTHAAQPPSFSSRRTQFELNMSTPASLVDFPSAARLPTPPRVHSLSRIISHPSQLHTTLSPNKSTPSYLFTSSSSTPPPTTLVHSSVPSLSSIPAPNTPVRRLKRKSRSRLNLRSPSTTTTVTSMSSSQALLRPKRSIPTLVPQLPTKEILEKRTHNSNPHQVFVNRLPQELLEVVFLLLIDWPSSYLHGSAGGRKIGFIVGGADVGTGTGGVDTKAPRTVSQVCHLWRCIALNEPLLWARTLNLREGPKWIIETLKRSGECMIDVVGLRETMMSSSPSSFRSRRSTRAEDLRGRGGTGSVLGVVLGELKRIRKLHLTIERKEEWRWFVDVLCKNDAPVLESLTVKSSVRRVANVPGMAYGSRYGGHNHSFGFNFDAFGGGDIGGAGGGEDVMRLSEGMFKSSAPVLKHLSLSMVTLSAVEPLPYLSQLTTLQVTDLEDAYLMSVWSWLSIVRQTPLLQSLILRSVFASEMPPSSPSHSVNVVLKKLRFIELKGSMMEACEFLEKLVVPGECKLAMNLGRANNAYATGVLGEWLRERKMRSEQMEGILRTPIEVVREQEKERRRGRSLLVHPSIGGLRIKINEATEPREGEERLCEDVEDEGDCVVNLALSFGFSDQSEERHRLIIEIFDILTEALQVVYEDKGGFDALNLSLFGVRDGIRVWEGQLLHFLAGLDRVEHLQELSGYTASILFPLLVQSPLSKKHQRRGSVASFTSIASTSPAERFRLNVFLPSLSKITLAFVEFAKNVDDEFEASCDVRAVPEFVKRRYGLGKEVGGISVVRQRVGSLRVRFECCSGPRSILDELRKLGVGFGLGWACDFEDD